MAGAAAVGSRCMVAAEDCHRGHKSCVQEGTIAVVAACVMHHHRHPRRVAHHQVLAAADMPFAAEGTYLAEEQRWTQCVLVAAGIVAVAAAAAVNSRFVPRAEMLF